MPLCEAVSTIGQLYTLQMLGRYHTREDILGTLRYEEDALRLLRYRINSVGYEITALGQRKYSSRGLTISRTRLTYALLAGTRAKHGNNEMSDN